MGEQVLDLVIPYIHNGEDRNSVSLVSPKFYEIDGITRKHLTVHTFYANPCCLSKRFPFTESLTLKGHPSRFRANIRITPWIQQSAALKFRCLKEVHIRGLVVHDDDLETLARACGKDLRSLKINKCKGFSTDGLRHVSKYCKQLRTLCFGYSNHMDVKDGIWLHQMALNNTVLERLHVKDRHSYVAENVTILTKNCCNSLISFTIGICYPSKLRDAFIYAVRLDHFGGTMRDHENELVDFQLPPNMRSLSIDNFFVTRYSVGRPFLNQITKLKLAYPYTHEDEDIQCLLFTRCPNLEVLHFGDQCGDRVMQVIGKFCKKLRKFTHHGSVTLVGLIALAKGCSKIECLKVSLEDISNKAIKCLGRHLKNLCKLHVRLLAKNDRVIDSGIRDMLRSCSKLEKLHIFCEEGLTDVGLEYIGKYGANLRSLSLDLNGNSNEGLVKLSKGCPKLRKLQLRECPFSKQFVAQSVFNITSLRYVWGYNNSDHGRLLFVLARPDFQL